ncbi:hypothetical protein OH768_06060 [Streptomyces sp. NBC_01622]|nr:hypothetical protein OH768_06060 [Streptomyces sp. NBC_01622]
MGSNHARSLTQLRVGNAGSGSPARRTVCPGAIQRVPYRKPLKFASGEARTADHVLVRLHTDEGLTGTAEAPPRPYTYGETQESIVAVIDMALWDILGQAAGIPVSGLLGGYTDRMRVSHMVGLAPAAAMVTEAERIRDTYGVTTFEVKVGRRPYTEDVAACRALREALGPDVELYIDGNRGWTASESARALREMADLGLTFTEELCPADDVLGRRWLVARSPVPFIADESSTRPRRGHPRTARRIGHRHQHQGRAHRLHRLPARPAHLRGAGRGSGDGQSDRRPDRDVVHRHLRSGPPQQLTLRG